MARRLASPLLCNEASAADKLIGACSALLSSSSSTSTAPQTLLILTVSVLLELLHGLRGELAIGLAHLECAPANPRPFKLVGWLACSLTGWLACCLLGSTSLSSSCLDSRASGSLLDGRVARKSLPAPRGQERISMNQTQHDLILPVRVCLLSMLNMLVLVRVSWLCACFSGRDETSSSALRMYRGKAK